MSDLVAEGIMPHDQTLLDKSMRLYGAIVSLRNQAPDEVLKVVETSVPMPETGVNGNTQEVIQSFMKTLQKHPDLDWTRMSLSVVPGSSKIISKSRFEAAFGAFADQYGTGYASEFFLPEMSRGFVDQVMQKAEAIGRPLSLPEQFDIALEISHGNVFAGVLSAHFGARAISRNMDKIISPRLQFSLSDYDKWKFKSVADLKKINEERGKTEGVLDVGDVYHFWGGVAGGLLTSTINHPRDVLFNLGYAAVHYFGDEITQLKDKITGIESKHLHGPADKAGFTTGRMLAQTLGTPTSSSPSVSLPANSNN